MTRFDMIVVGGGPAGLTAGLYAARAGRSVLLLEEAGFGGQIVTAPRVENYPGIPRLSGSEFAQQLVEQVLELGVEVELERASAIAQEPGAFRLSAGERAFTARSVILATGMKHRALGLPGEEALAGHGVSYCAVCDGAFFKGRRVAVIGGGDTALQDALFLAARCDRVFLIHRRDSLRGEARLHRELRRRENVEFLLSHIPEEFTEMDGQLRGLVLRNLKTGQRRNLPVEGAFLAVGQQPQNAVFAPPVALDNQGFVAAGESCATNVPGIFAAGDCRCKTVRQLTTAVGDGAAAAVAACHYLNCLET